MFSHASIFDHVCTCSTFLISRPLRTLEHAQQELGRKITDFDRRLQYKIEHDTAKREAPYERAAFWQSLANFLSILVLKNAANVWKLNDLVILPGWR